MRVAINKIDGVDSVTVSLNQGLATVWFEPNARVSIAQVRQAVRRNGFTPKAAEVRATGTIVEHDGRLAVSIPGTDAPYPVSDDSTDEVLQELRGLMGAAVSIHALAPDSAGRDANVTLQVRSVTKR